MEGLRMLLPAFLFINVKFNFAMRVVGLWQVSNAALGPTVTLRGNVSMPSVGIGSSGGCGCDSFGILLSKYFITLACFHFFLIVRASMQELITMSPAAGTMLPCNGSSSVAEPHTMLFPTEISTG